MKAPSRVGAWGHSCIALLGDYLVFVVFAVVGLRQHNEGGPVVEVATIVWPFALAWTAAAWWRGLFAGAVHMPADVVARRSLQAWLVAFPVALILRPAVERRAVPIGFDVVALLFNGLLLVSWRAAFAKLLARYGAVR